jgi:hypothetical protein
MYNFFTLKNLEEIRILTNRPTLGVAYDVVLFDRLHALSRYAERFYSCDTFFLLMHVLSSRTLLH